MSKQSYVEVIHDAKEGSPAWFHEERHGYQQQRFKAIVLFSLWSNFALCSCFFLSLLTKYFGYAYSGMIFYILSLWLLLDAMIEFDAHFYAIRKTSFKQWLLNPSEPV